jgi:hypothetical protein
MVYGLWVTKLVSEIVKLPAHRAGLPGNEISFLLCPFLPAGRQGPRLSRFGGTGHLPVKGLWLKDSIETCLSVTKLV